MQLGYFPVIRRALFNFFNAIKLSESKKMPKWMKSLIKFQFAHQQIKDNIQTMYLSYHVHIYLKLRLYAAEIIET